MVMLRTLVGLKSEALSKKAYVENYDYKYFYIKLVLITAGFFFAKSANYFCILRL